MSDEEVNQNDILEDGDNQDISTDDTPTEDISTDDTPSDDPTPTPITYCTVEDIINLFGDNVSDTIETNLISTAIHNATGWIHGRLRAKQVPLPDPTHYSSTIHTIAMYYTASDCYGALFNGDDYQINFDMWYIKAKELLDDYIDAYWNSCAEEDEQINHSVVRHSRGLTYDEKRRFRRRRF
jgi:hypothetical protein